MPARLRLDDERATSSATASGMLMHQAGKAYSVKCVAATGLGFGGGVSVKPAFGATMLLGGGGLHPPATALSSSAVSSRRSLMILLLCLGHPTCRVVGIASERSFKSRDTVCDREHNCLDRVSTRSLRRHDVRTSGRDLRMGDRDHSRATRFSADCKNSATAGAARERQKSSRVRACFLAASWMQ